MATEYLTKKDFELLKQDLLSEIKAVLQNQNSEPGKQWLKSYEVREMLGISRGTLQNLRMNGTLSATRIGGLLFYDVKDIKKLMTKR